jgi:hypothetical protein
MERHLSRELRDQGELDKLQRTLPERFRQIHPATLGKECCICLEDHWPLVAMVPCGHVSACRKCATPLHRCPVCNTPKTVVTYLYASR